MDEADHAQRWEERERALSLGAVLGAATEEHVIIDGEVVCMDCSTPLPQERLKAHPRALRCVPCQQNREA